MTGVPVRSPRRRSRGHEAAASGRGTLRWREARTGLALISPTVVLVLVLVVLPILWTVVLAFQDLRLIRLRTAGLFGDYTFENFVDVFSSPGFWQALVTTLVYAGLGTASAVGLGLVAQLALWRPFPGRGVVRAEVMLPYVAPVVAATFVWGVMLNPQFGIVNEIGTGDRKSVV